MTIDYESIGKRVKASRIQQKMTQAELAERTGMSDVYISRIETGVRSPSLSSLLKIVIVLNVSLDSLVSDAPTTGIPKEYHYFAELIADCNAIEREQVLKNAYAFKMMLRG